MLIITLSILATCLASSNCSVTHVRWGEGTSSVLFQWRPAFSALWRCGNSVVSVHHINNFWNTRSNLTKFSGQSPQWLRMVCAKLHVKQLRIDWDISEKRVKMMTKMPRDLWKRIVDSGFVAIVTVLSFLSFFVWRLLTSESDVKSHQKVQIGCFTSPSIRGISEKTIFSRLFSARYHILKRKEKKKTILGLCRCSVDNYSLNPGDLPCQF